MADKPDSNTAELIEVIGEEALVALADRFGGTRLFVPVRLPYGHAIVMAIGREAANRLSKRFAPDAIKVPLARERRAVVYREAGMSNATIARRLGLTETGVETLFKRLRARAAAAGTAAPA